MSDLISREYMKNLGATCIASRSKDGTLFPIVAIDELPPADPTHPTPSNTLGALDCVERQAAMKIRFSSGFDHDGILFVPYRDVKEHLKKLPSVQPEEAVPHRNYKYLSDFWCECGNHLGKKGDVKYCSDCGKKVKWDDNNKRQ